MLRILNAILCGVTFVITLFALIALLIISCLVAFLGTAGSPLQKEYDATVQNHVNLAFYSQTKESFFDQIHYVKEFIEKNPPPENSRNKIWNEKFQHLLSEIKSCEKSEFIRIRNEFKELFKEAPHPDYGKMPAPEAPNWFWIFYLSNCVLFLLTWIFENTVYKGK